MHSRNTGAAQDSNLEINSVATDRKRFLPKAVTKHNLRIKLTRIKYRGPNTIYVSGIYIVGTRPNNHNGEILLTLSQTSPGFYVFAVQVF